MFDFGFSNWANLGYKCENWFGVNLTHPVIASLDHPLFACGGKRGAWKRKWMKDKRQKKILPHPLSGEAEERVAQPNAGGSSVLNPQ
jgi:hypothetical protein